jgi:hypothetical protein
MRKNLKNLSLSTIMLLGLNQATIAAPLSYDAGASQVKIIDVELSTFDGVEIAAGNLNNIILFSGYDFTSINNSLDILKPNITVILENCTGLESINVPTGVSGVEVVFKGTYTLNNNLNIKMEDSGSTLTFEGSTITYGANTITLSSDGGTGEVNGIKINNIHNSIHDISGGGSLNLQLNSNNMIHWEDTLNAFSSVGNEANIVAQGYDNRYEFSNISSSTKNLNLTFNDTDNAQKNEISLNNNNINSMKLNSNSNSLMVHSRVNTIIQSGSIQLDSVNNAHFELDFDDTFNTVNVSTPILIEETDNTGVSNVTFRAGANYNGDSNRITNLHLNSNNDIYSEGDVQVTFQSTDAGSNNIIDLKGINDNTYILNLDNTDDNQINIRNSLISHILVTNTSSDNKISMLNSTLNTESVISEGTTQLSFRNMDLIKDINWDATINTTAEIEISGTYENSDASVYRLYDATDSAGVSGLNIRIDSVSNQSVPDFYVMELQDSKIEYINSASNIVWDSSKLTNSSVIIEGGEYMLDGTNGLFGLKDNEFTIDSLDMSSNTITNIGTNGVSGHDEDSRYLILNSKFEDITLGGKNLNYLFKKIDLSSTSSEFQKNININTDSNVRNLSLSIVGDITSDQTNSNFIIGASSGTADFDNLNITIGGVLDTVNTNNIKLLVGDNNNIQLFDVEGGVLIQDSVTSENNYFDFRNIKEMQNEVFSIESTLRLIDSPTMSDITLNSTSLKVFIDNSTITHLINTNSEELVMQNSQLTDFTCNSTSGQVYFNTMDVVNLSNGLASTLAAAQSGLTSAYVNCVLDTDITGVNFVADTVATGLQTNLDTANASLSSKTSQLNSANNELSSKSTQLTTANNALNTIRTDLNTKQTELTTATNNLSKVETKLSEKEKLILKINAENKALILEKTSFEENHITKEESELLLSNKEEELIVNRKDFELFNKEEVNIEVEAAKKVQEEKLISDRKEFGLYNEEDLVSEKNDYLDTLLSEGYVDKDTLNNEINKNVQEQVNKCKTNPEECDIEFKINLDFVSTSEEMKKMANYINTLDIKEKEEYEDINTKKIITSDNLRELFANTPKLASGEYMIFIVNFDENYNKTYNYVYKENLGQHNIIKLGNQLTEIEKNTILKIGLKSNVD